MFVIMIQADVLLMTLYTVWC